MDEQRNKIIDLALERFKQYGIRSVSIDDLCHELGMSKKTFYVYFKQKDELVQDVLRSMHENHCNKIDQAFSGKSTLECVRQMMDFMQSFSDVHQEPPFAYDLQKYYPDLYREHIDQVRRTTRDFITRHLEQGITEGVYRSDLDIEMCSIFFCLCNKHIFRTLTMSTMSAPNALPPSPLTVSCAPCSAKRGNGRWNKYANKNSTT